MVLTLNELRQMDGRPVWCKWWRAQGWALIHTDGSNVRLLHPMGCTERIDSDEAAARLDACQIFIVRNHPLTTADLRGMDGALVWVEDAAQAGGAFALLDAKEQELVLARADAIEERGRYFADADSGWSFGDGVKVFATQKEKAKC